MADLATIQEKLNSSAEERKLFLADPAKYLKDNGVVLPDEAVKQLTQNIKLQDEGDGATPLWSVGVVVGPQQ